MYSEVKLSHVIAETDKIKRYELPNHYRNWALVYLEKQETVAEIMGDDGTAITPIAKIISKKMPIGLTESEKRIVSRIVGKYPEVSWMFLIKVLAIPGGRGREFFLQYFRLEKERQQRKIQDRCLLQQQSIAFGVKSTESRILRRIWEELCIFFDFGSFSSPYYKWLDVSRKLALFIFDFPKDASVSSQQSLEYVVAVSLSPSAIPLRFVIFTSLCPSMRYMGGGELEKAEWLFKKLEGTETGLVHWKPKKLP